jgi:serine/threonine protein kinase
VENVRVVGRYALYQAIAAGGMATVHLGRLLGPVGFSRTVAIKGLHAQFASDPEFVSMFLDEARLAARIRHPNRRVLDREAEGRATCHRQAGGHSRCCCRRLRDAVLVRRARGEALQTAVLRQMT